MNDGWLSTPGMANPCSRVATLARVPSSAQQKFECTVVRVRSRDEKQAETHTGHPESFNRAWRGVYGVKVKLPYADSGRVVSCMKESSTQTGAVQLVLLFFCHSRAGCERAPPCYLLAVGQSSGIKKKTTETAKSCNRKSQHQGTRTRQNKNPTMISYSESCLFVAPPQKTLKNI